MTNTKEELRRHGAWGSDREEIYIDSGLSDDILETMTLDWDCY